MKQKILTFLIENSILGYPYRKIWEIIQNEVVTDGLTPYLTCSANCSILYKEGKIKRCKVNDGNRLVYHYYFEKV